MKKWILSGALYLVVVTSVYYIYEAIAVDPIDGEIHEIHEE